MTIGGKSPRNDPPGIMSAAAYAVAMRRRAEVADRFAGACLALAAVACSAAIVLVLMIASGSSCQ